MCCSRAQSRGKDKGQESYKGKTAHKRTTAYTKTEGTGTGTRTANENGDQNENEQLEQGTSNHNAERATRRATERCDVLRSRHTSSELGNYGLLIESDVNMDTCPQSCMWASYSTLWKAQCQGRGRSQIAVRTNHQKPEDWEIRLWLTRRGSARER